MARCRDVLALLSCTMVIGCYQTADEMTMEEFSHAYAEEYCRRISECCDEAEIMMFPLLSGEREPEHEWCVGGVASRVRMDFEFVLYTRRTVYDPDAARECVAAMRSGVCGDRTEQSDVCLDVLAPTADVGESCLRAQDCTTRGCLAPENVCGEPLGVGAACDLDENNCAIELRCSYELGVCEDPTPACDGL